MTQLLCVRTLIHRLIVISCGQINLIYALIVATYIALQWRIKIPNTKQKIINDLVSRRRTLKITQAQLANSCEIQQSMIGRFENNKTHPQLDTFLKIAHALNCDISAIELND